MRVKPFVAMLAAGALGLVAAEASAQDRWRIDVENGAAISGYNDVAIPGNTGTRFSMTDDLKSDTGTSGVCVRTSVSQRNTCCRDSSRP